MEQSEYIYRAGNTKDLTSLIELAVASWSGFKEVLTGENWNKLNGILNDPDIFIDLLNQSECILCTNIEGEIIGMAFLVPRGNPTHIYDADWSYIRFVSVHPDFGGKGIGKTLTEKCIKSAKENNEKIIALHTSEIMGKAISIYEKLGFRILRELEPSLGKKYWLYTLEL